MGESMMERYGSSCFLSIPYSKKHIFIFILIYNLNYMQQENMQFGLLLLLEDCKFKVPYLKCELNMISIF